MPTTATLSIPDSSRFVIGVGTSILGDPEGGSLANQQTFDLLRQEFRRVDVDPDTFSAMLAQRPEDALRALQALPDGAGSRAFIAKLRSIGLAPTTPSAPAPNAQSLDQRRRDKSA